MTTATAEPTVLVELTPTTWREIRRILDLEASSAYSLAQAARNRALPAAPMLEQYADSLAVTAAEFDAGSVQ